MEAGRDQVVADVELMLYAERFYHDGPGIPYDGASGARLLVAFVINRRLI